MMLVLGYQRRFMSDDGLIYTRAIRQILAGNGPVYNVGERAEASTSTIWPWLVALGSWVTRIEPDRLAVFGGLGLTVLGLGLAVDATCRLHGRDGTPRLLVPAGVVVILALPPAWDFASSGMESGLGTLWLGACWWLLVRARPDQRLRATAFTAAIFGLGPMVRPELALVSACFLAALWVVVRPGWRHTLVCLVAAGALPFAYEVFRAGYYGVLFPLPALAKEGTSSDWPRGVRYLRDFVGPYWLWWPAAGGAVLAGFVAVRRRRVAREPVVVAAPVVAGLVSTAYIVVVGGDFMHARMLLPPLMMLLLPILVVPAGRVTVVAAAAILVWAVVGLTPLRGPYTPRPGVQEIRTLDMALTKNRHPVTASDWIAGWPGFPEEVEAALAAGTPTLLYGDPGKLLRAQARPDLGVQLVLHEGWLGMVGAVVPLDQIVADEWSLSYPLGAHLAATAPDSIPGHQKPVPWAWMFADYADPAAPPPEGANPDEVAAARRALACGELRELQESVRAPMSPGRFWKNLTGSVRRTRLRIPADPFAAEQRFCTNA